MSAIGRSIQGGGGGALSRASQAAFATDAVKQLAEKQIKSLSPDSPIDLWPVTLVCNVNLYRRVVE